MFETTGPEHSFCALHLFKLPSKSIAATRSRQSSYYRWRDALRWEVQARPAYVRGLAYLRGRAGAEAMAEFQKIIAHRGVVAVSALYPLAHLGLARAAALVGDTAKSRKAYEDFFALWKDADPDIPILQQAKQEYDKLK